MWDRDQYQGKSEESVKGSQATSAFLCFMLLASVAIAVGVAAFGKGVQMLASLL